MNRSPLALPHTPENFSKIFGDRTAKGIHAPRSR
jgi:hypothetical protein